MWKLHEVSEMCFKEVVKLTRDKAEAESLTCEVKKPHFLGDNIFSGSAKRRRYKNAEG